MCCPCGNLCCGSDEFGRCGCDDCPDPRCHDTTADDVDFGHGLDIDEDDDALMLLAASGCAAAQQFRCDAVGEPTSGGSGVLGHLKVEPQIQAERPLFAQRNASALNLAITDEGQVLRNAAGRHHAYVSSGFRERQHGARHVEAAEADRGRRVRGRLGEVLVGHAARILGGAAASVGMAWLPVRCGAATAGANAMARL